MVLMCFDVHIPSLAVVIAKSVRMLSGFVSHCLAMLICIDNLMSTLTATWIQMRQTLSPLSMRSHNTHYFFPNFNTCHAFDLEISQNLDYLSPFLL